MRPSFLSLDCKGLVVAPLMDFEHDRMIPTPHDLRQQSFFDVDLEGEHDKFPSMHSKRAARIKC